MGQRLYKLIQTTRIKDEGVGGTCFLESSGDEPGSRDEEDVVIVLEDVIHPLLFPILSNRPRLSVARSSPPKAW